MLLADAESGDVSAAEAEASDRRQAIVAAVQGTLFVLTAAAFVAWFYRAYTNVTALGAGYLRFRHRWAIWGWFVPVLNYWRPKQVANDIWRGSDPDAPEAQGGGWQGASVPGLFLLWWLAFLFAQTLYNASFRQAVRADEVHEFRAANAVTIAADGLSIVAGALAIAVVWRTTARQEARASRLGVPAEELPTPVYRRRSAWAAFVAVVAVLAVQGALGAALWTGAFEPSEAAAPDPAAADDANVLLFDDFEDPASGWLDERRPAYSYGYDDGRYQITAFREAERHSYLELVEPVEGVDVAVVARMLLGEPQDGYGVGCWVGDDAGYFGYLYADGFYAIVRDPPGNADLRRLAGGLDRSGAVRRGEARNAVRLECVRRGDEVRLGLSANGDELAAAAEPRPVGPFTGVGLFVVSPSGSTDVRFDDFVVRRPTSGS